MQRGDEPQLRLASGELARIPRKFPAHHLMQLATNMGPAHDTLRRHTLPCCTY